MPRRLRSLSLFLVATATMSCFLGSDSAVTPIDLTQAAAEFESPTGTVSDSNAVATVNMALVQNFASGALYSAGMNYGMAKQNTAYANCLSAAAEAGKTTLDFKCLSDAGGFGIYSEGGVLQTACTGSGKMTVTGDTRYLSYMTEIAFEAFSSSCNHNGTLYEISSFSGDYQATALEPPSEDPDYACINVTLTARGNGRTYNGCWSHMKLERILIDAGGGPVLVTFPSSLSNCTNLCVDIQDKNGTGKVDCVVNDKWEGCSHLDEIVDVSTCTITRDATCGT
ncbi:MAG: hypothetical protein V1495_01720 [Pseudomonadota bacterium]